MEPASPPPDRAARPSLRARLLPLRRPPLLSVVEGRFVPERCSLDEVDEAWAELRRRVPRAHDGPMLHVLGVSRNGHGGVTVHCVGSSYRFHAVARVGLDTGMRPLGVKGIAFTPGGGVLVARRAEAVLNYPGMWEFVPAGTMEPGMAPGQMLLRELAEETGWEAVAPPAPRALLFDPVVRSWEVVFTLEVRPPAVPVEAWECESLTEAVPGHWPGPPSSVALQMMPVVEGALRARGHGT
jgi:8-oxo-dGTP pyrophosphatase MutT (NUDIX family)